MKYKRLRALGIASAVLALLPHQVASTQVTATGPIGGVSDDGLDLNDLTLEELMNIEVTVASRKAERLADVPAAVYVLTGDEIRRAGHASIQEALRMVPGFHVSHWTNQSWDVTARGFSPGLSPTNFAYLNQLLVMIDGVVVYTPLFAGVWWALQDIDMDDVDRIEIIRGPGGIMWGANTLHGIVHVITKNAADTVGAKASVRVGRDDDHASVRYGIPVDNGYVRVWGKRSTYDDPHNVFAGFRSDWWLNSGGFRADLEDDDDRQYTVWGRVYDGDFRNIGFDLTTFVPFSSADNKSGGQIFGSVTNPETGSRFSAWYSRDRQNIHTLVDIDIETLDLEYQGEIELTDDNSVTWGVGFQQIASDLFGDDPFWLDFEPRKLRQENYRVFAVDNIEFPEQNVSVVLGLQLEKNHFVDWQLQPSLRTSWQASEDLMLWGAISRAIRTPSLEETTATQFDPMTGTGSIFEGDPNFRSEKLVAFELGGRLAISEKAAADVALFYNEYDDLHLDPPALFGPISNGAEGKGYGGEIAMDFKPTERWSLRSAYSYSYASFHEKATGARLNTDDQSPERIFNIRSYYEINEDIEFDTALYRVNGLGSALNEAEYFRVDARLGYRPNRHVEWAIGVQNATDPHHSELDEFDQIRRSVYISLTWRPGDED